MSYQSKEQLTLNSQELPLDMLEAEGGSDNDPIRYYIDTRTHDRYVRLLSPDNGFPLIIQLPKPCKEERVSDSIKTWEKINNEVMLDPISMKLLIEILSRFARTKRQPLFIEGPPAVSKTFLIWVAACILEMPYVRVTFSGSSTESTFIGGPQPNTEFRLNLTLQEVLGSSAVTKVVSRIEGKAVSDRTTKEQEQIEIVGIIKDNLTNNIPTVKMKVDIQMLENLFGISIIDRSNYVWKDHPMIWAVEAGGLVALDEPNLANTKIFEVLLSFLDINTTEIHVSGNRPGPVIKHKDSIIVGAQNPPKVKGRQILPGSTLSRVDHIILPPITGEFVRNLLEFFIYGRDPKMLINGSMRSGRTNVPTNFRQLEMVPLIDGIIKTITDIFVTIIGLIDNHEIGTSVSEGGNYEFDQRKIYRLLEAILSFARNQSFSEHNSRLEYEPVHWSKAIKEAMRKTFLSGMSGSETTGDYARVKAIIDNNPLWKLLDKQRPGIPSYVGGNMSGWVSGETFTPDF